jgi:sedoheptulokinase
MRVILSLDIGTSKIAAVAFDCLNRKNLAVLSIANAATVAGLTSGRHEQDPRAIYRDCLELLGRLLGCGEFAPGDVAALAVAGQMHGLLLVDRGLEPLGNLVTWCDQRATGLTSSLDRATWPTRRTGCYLHPGYGGATLAFLAAENRLPDGAVALSIADFVAARLCGVAATESTQAAAWGILDLRRGGWDEELVARLSIPRGVLPEIRTRSRELGTLRAGLGRDLSLPGELLVFSPLGDNQASYIGSCGLEGLAGARERTLLLNLGTGGQISIPSADFAFTGELETRPMPFGGYLLVGMSLCGGRSYAILKDFFRAILREFAGQNPGDDQLYEVMNRLASAEPGTVAAVDTRFAGTRMDPSIRGSIVDIGIGDLSPAALSRGVALGMVRELTSQIPGEMLRGLDRVLAGGNAVRSNPAVQRLIAEELGLPCELAAEKEEAATGAALVAAAAMGMP